MNPSRRLAFSCLACAALAPFGGARAAAGGAQTTLSPAQALERLMAGNRRFVADVPAPPMAGAARRTALAAGQAPYAALLGCADSRTPPELLFSEGLGELFTVRVAGNSLGLTELGSLEYASEALGVALVVVLGHESCGAVSAALQVAEEGVTLPFALAALVEPILPAIAEAKRGNPANLHDATVRVHARRVSRQLNARNSVLTPRITTGALRVVAAYYNLREGQVTLLDD